MSENAPPARHATTPQAKGATSAARGLRIEVAVVLEVRRQEREEEVAAVAQASRTSRTGPARWAMRNICDHGIGP